MSRLPLLSLCSPLPAAAALHHHVLVILQHHPVLRVQVEQGDGAEGGWDAAGPRHCSIHWVYQSLHHGVARGVHVVGQGEATLSQAEEGVVAAGCNDPLVPANIVEIYVQRMAAASVTRKAFQFRSTPAISFHPPSFAPTNPILITPPTRHCVNCFFGPCPGLVPAAALAVAPRPLFCPFSPSHPLAATWGPPAMFDQRLSAPVMTISHQEGSLLGPAMLVLTHRPAHPQVALFVFLCLLLTGCWGEAPLRGGGGAVLRSDLQEKAQAATTREGLMEELRT